MTIPNPVCDCGTRKEPTAKRGLLQCPHCDRGCTKINSCAECRLYARSLAHRVNS